MLLSRFDAVCIGVDADNLAGRVGVAPCEPAIPTADFKDAFVSERAAELEQGVGFDLFGVYLDVGCFHCDGLQGGRCGNVNFTGF